MQPDFEHLAKELESGLDAPNAMRDLLGMISGKRRLLALALTPLPEAFQTQVAEFVHTGTGQLAGLAQHFIRQGAPPASALGQAQDYAKRIQGFLVLFSEDDQHADCVTTVFTDDSFTDGKNDLVKSLAQSLATPSAEISAAVDRLCQRAVKGGGLETMIAAPGGSDDPAAIWSTLARRLLHSRANAIHGGGTDLSQAFGLVAMGLARTERSPSLSRRLDRSRCHALGGQTAEALESLTGLLPNNSIESETLEGLVCDLVEGAIRSGNTAVLIAGLGGLRQALEGNLGGSYEVERAIFRALTASQASGEDLIAAVERLQKADKRAWRHDLTREPLWSVTFAPKETISVEEAATLLGRSTSAVSKRLETGRLPTYRDAENHIVIPKQAFLAWKAVVERFSLLD